jgi:hypothetical protein
MHRATTLLLLALLVLPADAADTVAGEAVGLRFAVPEDWKRMPTRTELRAAEFRLPAPKRGTEDGTLVLHRFGKASGEGVDDNVARWLAEFRPTDGRTAREAATVTHRTANGLAVTVYDVSGTFQARLGPIQEAPKPDWRMLGAVVEGEGGPWFWRAVGPAATIEEARPGFDALIGSLAPAR